VGVPHIEAASDAGVAFGFGWCQARAHGDLLLRLYGQARGRAAEYWGGSTWTAIVWSRRWGNGAGGATVVLVHGADNIKQILSGVS
jgi:acyl-homoserine-lactone acylase